MCPPADITCAPLQDANISDEVKAAKIAEIMKLKGMAGFDWRLAATCGTTHCMGRGIGHECVAVQ